MYSYEDEGERERGDSQTFEFFVRFGTKVTLTIANAYISFLSRFLLLLLAALCFTTFDTSKQLQLFYLRTKCYVCI